jgi:hypothetical protein
VRARATIFGTFLLLALARPAAAQFSTTMGSAMSGSTGSSNTSTTSSIFSQLLGNRTSVPTTNFLSNFPTAPKTYGTMLGRTPTGTTPQVVIVGSPRQTTPFSFFRKKQSN